MWVRSAGSMVVILDNQSEKKNTATQWSRFVNNIRGYFHNSLPSNQERNPLVNRKETPGRPYFPSSYACTVSFISLRLIIIHVHVAYRLLCKPARTESVRVPMLSLVRDSNQL
ncbi:hypothetical protein PM082_022887 [Marasmius tenuissimus]|nr:hypothetical protein PM082_022887 [Marasmius tenuissimus]